MKYIHQSYLYSLMGGWLIGGSFAFYNTNFKLFLALSLIGSAIFVLSIIRPEEYLMMKSFGDLMEENRRLHELEDKIWKAAKEIIAKERLQEMKQP